MLEYVLLLAIVVGLVAMFKPQLQKIFTQATGAINTQATDVFNSNGPG